MIVPAVSAAEAALYMILTRRAFLMKKTLCLFLALLMLMIPVLVACDGEGAPVDSGTNAPGTDAPGTDTPGTDDPDAPYSVAGDFGYVVTEDGSAKVVIYLGEGGKVVIPEELDGKTVTAIGMMAFARNKTITELSLPGTLSDTGELSFFGCEALTSVVIGEGVTSIGRSSFNKCFALKSVTLPSTLTMIDEIAFQECMALENITIPEGVTHIGMRAFANCKSLQRMELPATLSSVGREVFLSCEAITEIIFKSSMSHLADDLFAYCYSLKNVVLPEGITYLDNSLFYRCTSLESFVFPKTVYGTGQRVFYGCQALKEVYIPVECATAEDDLDIGYYSFWFVPALTDVYFGGTQEQWDELLNGMESFNDTLIEATINLGAAMPQ